MIPKILHWVGLTACILLIVSCFVPWTYYPVLNETFTGFNAKSFPNGTYYGKPGYFIVTITLIIIALMLIPRVWAKRINLFLSAFLIAYVLSKSHIFTNSLFKDEVVEKPGIFLIVINSSIIMISSLFPNLKIKEEIKF